MNSELLTGGLAILTLVIGIVAGYFVFKSNYEKKVVAARESAEMILEDAKKDADRLKKEVLLEAKEENHKYRTEVENELKERRNEVLLQEKRMIQREQNLDRKDEVLEKREQSIEDKENNLVNFLYTRIMSGQLNFNQVRSEFETKYEIYYSEINVYFLKGT